MRKIVLLPVIAVFIAIISVPTYSALAVGTINFDGFPHGTVITTQYQSQGVKFTTDAHIFEDTPEATSQKNVLVPSVWDQTRSGDLDFSIVDSSGNPTGTSSVSFKIISIGINPVTVTIKDTSNNIISGPTTYGPHDPIAGSATNDPSGCVPGCSGIGVGNVDNVVFSSDSNNIGSVIIHGNGEGSDGYGIDDLCVGGCESPQIPEFPIPFSMVIIFVAVAAVYMGIRQKMPGFKSF